MPLTYTYVHNNKTEYIVKPKSSLTRAAAVTIIQYKVD